MEVKPFKALIPIDNYLRNHKLQAGDLVCADIIINLQNITNTMVVGISRLKAMTVIEVMSESGLIALSTHPVNSDVRSVTKWLTSGTYNVYIIKQCCLVSDIKQPIVSQGNLFEDGESIPH